MVHHGRDDQAHQHDVNVGGTELVMRLAAEIGARVVFVSTSGVSGCSMDPTAAPDEEAPTCDAVIARWPYYVSKLAAERALGRWRRRRASTLASFAAGDARSR